MTISLRHRTIFITGATRGIGKSVALRAAADGANIVILGKTEHPHPKLPGTVRSACDEVERAGGRALGCVVDVRQDDQVAAAVERAATHFGGIDILVNNASAIFLTDTAATAMARFDLMHQVNTRATFMCSKFCLPHLLRSDIGHIVTLSPPLNLEPQWLAPHLGYTLSKFGMSLCTLGLAAELSETPVRVNSLWPKTIIATAAIEHLLGSEALSRSRHPSIVADAAHALFTRRLGHITGQLLLDEDVLRSIGVTDLRHYALDPTQTPLTDLFLHEASVGDVENG